MKSLEVGEKEYINDNETFNKLNLEIFREGAIGDGSCFFHSVLTGSECQHKSGARKTRSNQGK